jgi:outer membrane protein OmpA-like peptidoglycan-associated protein
MQFLLRPIIVLFSSVLLFSCAIQKKNKKSYVKQNFESLKIALPNAEVTMLGDTIKVLFADNIMFATNSSAISEQFVPSVQKFAKVLKRYNKTTILINGYTDNTGTLEINTKLSSDRANSAKDALIKETISPNRMFSWGHGSNYPIASNETAEGRQKNRRVEFLVLYDVE